MMITSRDEAFNAVRQNGMSLMHVPDELKSGGAYEFKSDSLVRISPEKKTLTLADGTTIRFDDVAGIESELFRGEF